MIKIAHGGYEALFNATCKMHKEFVETNKLSMPEFLISVRKILREYLTEQGASNKEINEFLTKFTKELKELKGHYKKEDLKNG